MNAPLTLVVTKNNILGWHKDKVTGLNFVIFLWKMLIIFFHWRWKGKKERREWGEGMRGEGRWWEGKKDNNLMIKCCNASCWWENTRNNFLSSPLVVFHSVYLKLQYFRFAYQYSFNPLLLTDRTQQLYCCYFFSFSCLVSLETFGVAFQII